jgi:hypothetical protein
MLSHVNILRLEEMAAERGKGSPEHVQIIFRDHTDAGVR